MQLDRIDLADIHEPKRLVKALHRQIGPLAGQVPVDEIARALGIEEIRRAPLEGCEGVLLTDRVRSRGRILVNNRRSAQSARFGIAHELGHFLLERHVLGLGGVFRCTIDDMRESRTVRQHRRQEVEANEFAIGLLVPDDRLAPCLRQQPEIEVARTLCKELDLSLEATMRCLIERHPEPVAAVWAKDGRIRYSVRGGRFPWIERGRDQPVSRISRTAEALAAGRGSAMQEVAAAAWTLADIPELFEEVHLGKEGHTLALLWATLPDRSANAGGNDEDDDDDDED